MNRLIFFGVKQFDKELIESPIHAPIHVTQVVAGLIFAIIEKFQPLAAAPRFMFAAFRPLDAFFADDFQLFQLFQKFFVKKRVECHKKR